jgi:predicted DNA-binding transcriptional regulator YafY
MLSAGIAEDAEMRRADRLFQIIQILRRTRRPVTAEAIADELETSKRTIYRDIADMIGRRVPIRGEAGLGYVLEHGFDLPPLMLTADEIEAAVLGAQWVSQRGDPILAKAALDLLSKIGQAIPERLREHVLEPVTVTQPAWTMVADGVDLVGLRAQVRAGRKISLRYEDELGRSTDRVIWPVAISYLDAKRLLIGWCELRGAFRHFRTDRITQATLLDERYPARPSQLRAQWRQSLGTRARSV